MLLQAPEGVRVADDPRPFYRRMSGRASNQLLPRLDGLGCVSPDELQLGWKVYGEFLQAEPGQRGDAVAVGLTDVGSVLVEPQERGSVPGSDGGPADDPVIHVGGITLRILLVARGIRASANKAPPAMANGSLPSAARFAPLPWRGIAALVGCRRVVRTLEKLFVIRSRPQYLRSDNGPEFASKAVRKWLKRSGVGTLFIEPGAPWENGYVESFNGKLEDECLNSELFLSLAEARYVVDRWRMDYNHHRPHSMLDWITPAAFAASCPRKGRPCVPPDSATPHPPEHKAEALA